MLSWPLRLRGTAFVVVGALLAAISTVALLPQPAAAQGGNCPNQRPPLVETADCDFGGGFPRQTHGESFELSVPAGAGGNRCYRPHGVPNDSSAAELDQYGPQDIVCEWRGTGQNPRYRGHYSSTWDCYMVRAENSVPVSGMTGYASYGDDEDARVYVASCFPPPHHADSPAVADTARGLGHWRTGPFGGYVDPDGGQWGGLGAPVVVPGPPDQAEPAPSLIDLWVEAINSLTMWAPAPATAPPLDTAGLVNLPMWLWTEETDRTWPEELSVTVGGGDSPWTIDAFARPVRMVWEMGDGGTATCPDDSPGVAWHRELPLLDPPDDACTYTYRQPSTNEPGGTFEILALTTWYVSWDINGQFDNDVEIEIGTYRTFQVNELQVLTGRR